MAKGPSKKSNDFRREQVRISCVDLFCGAGGLTRGLIDEGLKVNAGVDLDEACEYPYEENNGAKFVLADVATLKGAELMKLYGPSTIRVLVGCAPCQPFSKYTQGLDSESDTKWPLLRSFARLIRTTRPHVVSMENVPELQKHIVFSEFVSTLESLNYHISFSVAFCPAYGVPQHRSRLVLFASLLGKIEILKPQVSPNEYRTVEQAIGHLSRLAAGGIDESDPLHRSSRLSDLNLKRIQVSKPGGTWSDWPPSLVATCHQGEKGKTYRGVYGRMEWNVPSPTITTQFFGFGNGRFGHPEQNRGISLREGAILQTFPADYKFVAPGDEYEMKTLGRLIGNAVPVRLGRVIGKSILQHINEHNG